MSAVGLEQLEHAGLAAARLAGECPRYLVRQMVVAHGHDITIAEGDDGHLGRRPWTDARQRGQQAARLHRVYASHRLEPAGPRRGGLNNGEPPALDPEAMHRPVRGGEYPRRLGRQQQAAVARCRLA